MTSCACSRLSGLDVRYGKPHADDVLRAERLRREKCRDGGVQAAGQRDEALLVLALRELVANEGA